MGYVIFANKNYIYFSNNTNITFIFVPSGYYYYYNISDLYIYQNQTNKGVTTVDYICSPNPSSGILLVNQNINVSIIYNCNRVS